MSNCFSINLGTAEKIHRIKSGTAIPSNYYTLFSLIVKSFSCPLAAFLQRIFEIASCSLPLLPSITVFHQSPLEQITCPLLSCPHCSSCPIGSLCTKHQGSSLTWSCLLISLPPSIFLSVLRSLTFLCT